MQVESSEIDTNDKHVNDAADAAVREYLNRYHQHSNRTELPSMSLIKVLKAQKNGTTYKIGFETAPPVECGMFLLEICLPPQLCKAEVSEKVENKMKVNRVRCDAINNGSGQLLPVYQKI